MMVMNIFTKINNGQSSSSPCANVLVGIQGRESIPCLHLTPFQRFFTKKSQRDEKQPLMVIQDAYFLQSSINELGDLLTALDTIHKCDRRTDRRTEMSASCGKNCSVLGLYSHFSKKMHVSGWLSLQPLQSIFDLSRGCIVSR